MTRALMMGYSTELRTENVIHSNHLSLKMEVCFVQSHFSLLPMTQLWHTETKSDAIVRFHFASWYFFESHQTRPWPGSFDDRTLQRSNTEQ